MAPDLRGRSFLRELDYSRDELVSLVELAGELKAAHRAGAEQRRLEGRTIALLFEKSSTRTRSAFEVAAFQQGAQVTYIGPVGSHLGREESIADTAQVLGRWYDGIAYRGFGQDRVEALAAHAGVPVWNGLTDAWHPTQTLADVMTMQEATGRPAEELSLCFLGDTHFNMACSLLAMGAALGMDVRLSGPPSLRPPGDVMAAAEERAARSGARLRVLDDPRAAVDGVDFVYTDVWVSMGESTEAWDDRLGELSPYRVDQSLMGASGNPQVRFLHCLPALHDRETTLGELLYDKTGQAGVEVADEVFRSDASLVFDQAENRMHAIKALMVATLVG